MPSFGYTPAQLAWTGGDIGTTPTRFSYVSAAIKWTAAVATLGPNLATGLAANRPKLDRLQRGQRYYDGEGVATLQMQALWQKTVETIEAAFTSIIEQNNQQQVTLDMLVEVQNTAIGAAQEAQAVTERVELGTSSTIPVDGNLSASSDGVITIAAHDRKYSDSNIVPVDGGSLTGWAPGDFVRVYYRDAARAGGAVAYQGTLEDVTQSDTVHVVGGVTIPASGSPPSSGVGTSPPGYVRPPLAGSESEL